MNNFLLKVLFLFKWLFNFEPSDLRGDKSASLMRLFSFKENTNKRQVSAFSNEVGVSTKLRQRLALFICLNFVESIMAQTQSSCRRMSSRRPLDDKFSILSLAIETAIAKISQIEGSESINAKGIRIAFKEFTKHYKSFTEKHGLFPGNEVKLQQAASKCRAPYNHILNGVLESVNIIPGSECLN